MYRERTREDAIKLRDLQFYCAPFFLYIFKPIYTFKFTILCLYLYINVVIPVENYAYISLYVFSHFYKLYSFQVIKTDLSIFIPYGLNYIFIPNRLLINIFLTRWSFIEIIRLLYHTETNIKKPLIFKTFSCCKNIV